MFVFLIQGFLPFKKKKKVQSFLIKEKLGKRALTLVKQIL